MNIKNLVTDVTEVPSTWVFETWLKDKLERKLEGQGEMIKSLFNPKDKVPSMSIYVKGSQYRWHDFSTGNGGNKIDLVMKMERLDYGPACTRLVNQYNDYILKGNSNPVTEFKVHSKYQITGWQRRKWTVTDKNYWTQYEISSSELNYFSAYPLSEYELTKDDKRLVIQGGMIYGYFTASGELYKVYQPYSVARKFMKVLSHVQGLDQLLYKTDILVITKALKDVITLYKIGFESIAPDSENSLIGEKVMKNLLDRYKIVLTLFDNDDAGILGMKKYEDKWGIRGMNLLMEKDPSDSVKKHGSPEVKRVITEVLNKLI